MTKSEYTIRWLEWAQEIQAIAQIGNTYAENDFQHQRYDRLLGIAAEMISEHTVLSKDMVLMDFGFQKGYATPKVDVRGAVFRDGRILMVQEKSDDGWTMPGGWADVGDYPATSVEREVWEESGFTVKARRLIGVYDANRVKPLDYYHAYKLVFLCDVVSGSPRASLETRDVAFFLADEVPENLSGERTRSKHIRDAFEFLSNPSLPTFFE